MDTQELAALMKPDTWRCSLCGLLGDSERGTLILRVPKTALVHFESGEDGSAVPLIIKLHPGKCQSAWDEQLPARADAPGQREEGT